MSQRLRGDRLYVNLSAAATRARLAGRGLAVRKVHSAGHHQAVIIHTATGRYLATLQELFRDVGWSTTEQGLGQPLTDLRNLGPASAAWLQEAGIPSIADLRRLGPVAAYRMVRRQRPDCSMNLLWAIAAGLEGKDWRELTDAQKADLRKELESS